MKALPKLDTLPRFPPGTTTQSGKRPARCLQDAVHDRLLPLEAERVDAVDEIDSQLAAHLLHLPERIVEVAGDLHGQRAVFECLRQLAVAIFPEPIKITARRLRRGA